MKLPTRTILRLGSTTETNEILKDVKEHIRQRGFDYVEINTPQAVRNSSNKINMKTAFTNHDVPTARWFIYKDDRLWEQIKGDEIHITDIEDVLPLLAKRITGSRGRGMVKLDTKADFDKFIRETNLRGYYFEKFYDYGREYRLHVHKNGCFYSCRKVRKKDTPEGEWYYFNNQNCNWLLPENAGFDRPVNWDNIVSSCIDALHAVGLDVGACDLRIQNTTNRRGEVRSDPSYIVVEINSAPSFGDLTYERYMEEIPTIYHNLEKKTFKL